MQVFIQALLAVVVFGINVKFSDKDAYLQDKQSCSWGCREGEGLLWTPLSGFRAEPCKFCDFLLLRPLQMWFCLFWITHCQLSSNTIEIKITPFEGFEAFKTGNHRSPCIVKNGKCSFFKMFFTGNLKGTSSFSQNQTTQIKEPQDFISMWFFQMKWNNSWQVSFY